MLTAREEFIVLTDNEKLRKVDAIVILEGDGSNRISKGCELYKSGFAEHLIFSGGIINHVYGSFPFDEIKGEFETHGVNPQIVINENKSLHTRQQAEFVIDICTEKKWESFILVASHYHQYRAFLTFLKVLEERDLDRSIKIINAPVTELNWFVPEPWGRRIELLQSEFKKIEEYRQQGHISDYEKAIAYFTWKASA